MPALIKISMGNDDIYIYLQNNMQFRLNTLIE
jgi:hypothetical protein